MTPEIEALWRRAKRALETARLLAQRDPDGAVSRAYYAAFYAVTALFALAGGTFRKHTALEGAVHRDLVKTGRWDADSGAAFSDLAKARMVADYGAIAPLTPDDAVAAVRNAQRVLDAVQQTSPEPLPED
jgi:uncharacterized protein (UPF0332 family)